MWIAVTLLAASLQIARTSEQHRLRSTLNTAEAGYVRFAYAFPAALTFTLIWVLGPGNLPTPGARFWLSVTGGGIAQILGTMALLQAFKLRNFALGTTYAKTEVLFVGAGSALILGEPLSLLGWLGVIVCLTGVVWLATGGADPKGHPKNTEEPASPHPQSHSQLGRPRHSQHDQHGQGNFKVDPASLFGILAAAGFSLAAIGIRSASTSLDGATVERALFTMTAMLGVQTLIQGIALARSSGSSLRNVAHAWRPSLIVAGLSLSGSLAWATAMTLENAAKVRTLGQIEIVLAFAIGVMIHRERHRFSEYLASAVTTAGIILLVVS